MKRTSRKKFISVFLSLIMLFTMFGSVSFANAYGVTGDPTEVTNSPAEVRDPLAEVIEPPAEVIEPPTEVTNPPVEVTDPPAEVTEPPTEVTDPLAEVTDLPIEFINIPTEVTTFDMLTINWIMRERVAAIVFDMGEGNEVLTSSLDNDTFTVHCRNNNASGVQQNAANRNIAAVYANTVPEMLDPFSRETRDSSVIPQKGRYVVVELVFWPIAKATSAATASDSMTYKQVYTVTQNKAFMTADGQTFDPGTVTYMQGRRINDVIDRFEYEMSTSTPMRLFTPDKHWDFDNNQKLPVAEITKPLPLVILTHGGSQGSDNETHLRYMNSVFFAWPEIQEEYPAYVLMPTSPAGWGKTQFDNIKIVVDGLIAEGRVDPNRIYSTGHSMGGIGTWNLAANLPEGYLAAIAPISAASTPSYNVKYTDLPIWEFGTTGDSMGPGSRPGATDWRFSLNNYANTVFPDNTAMYFKGMYYSNPEIYNATSAPNQLQKHAGWVPAYNFYGWEDLPEYEQYSYYRDDLSKERGRLIDWLFAQSNDSEPEPNITWRQVDPADVEIGRNYLIVSEYGALANAQATIKTPGDVTGDNRAGMMSKPVTIENGLITSEVTEDMIWQFGLGSNTAAASGGLGGVSGYYLLNNAPGTGGGTEPLRRESSFNGQHAAINTTSASINGNQQSLLLHVLNQNEGIVSLYYWGGNNQWNFALTSTEDGFIAKSKAASATSATQLLDQMQQSPPLRLYEPNVTVGGQYYVMASAGENGTISPSSLTGHVWVNDGEDVTFTFNPAFGFEVDKVTVNDEEVAVTDNKYTIKNIIASGTRIHVTFKSDSNAKDLPFTVYNDIFSVGNVTTALVIDLGEGKAAKLNDLSADMFMAAARNTRLDGSTVIFDGSRKITRVYVNNNPEPLGYISPAPGSDDLVTATPASGRYIIVEFEFWNANGYTSGSMVSGNLQNAFSAILNYRVNVDDELKLTDGTTIIPRFTQAQVVNPALGKFVHTNTNPGGTGSMDILISIDESWETKGALPLFIYNHGGGRGGSAGDYFAPMQTANGAAVLSKLQLENPGKYNAHIIATQNHSDNQDNNLALIAYVQNLVAEGKVDPNRIYMSGFSMGSMYTAGLYRRYPEFLAAIVLQSGGDLPTVQQLTANPEYTKTAIWAYTHKDDFMGTTWTNYFSTGAGASGLYQEANAAVLNTNQAFNFPYYGFDWTPHETEAQAYSNRIGQSNALYRYGPSHEKYADKNIFDWMFAQDRSRSYPIISSINKIVHGKVNPSITVSIGSPYLYTEGASNTANWGVDFGGTGLALDAVIIDEQKSQATLSFKGTAQPGNLKVSAKADALDSSGLDSNVLNLEIKENTVYSERDALVHEMKTGKYTTASIATAQVVVDLVNDALLDGMNEEDENEWINSLSNARKALVLINQVSLLVSPNTILSNNANTITFQLEVNNLQDVSVMEGILKIPADKFRIKDIVAKDTGENVVLEKNLDYMNDGTTAKFVLGKVGGFDDAAKVNVLDITVEFKGVPQPEMLEMVLDSLTMYLGNVEDNTAVSVYSGIVGDGKASTYISISEGTVVTALTVIGKDGAAKITTKGGTLQMVATVTPADATDKSVTWSIVSGSDYANLSADGLLTAKANGTVTVKATSVSNPSVSNTCNIVISGYSSGSGSGGGGSTTKPVVPTVPPVTNPSTPDVPKAEPVKVSVSLTTGAASSEGKSMTLTVKPYVENGRTMAGVRDIAGMLHVEQKDVVWNAKDKSIVINSQGTLIKLVIGQKYAIVNGQKIALDVAPQVKDGRTVLPVAQIARLLNIETQYDAKTKEITFIIKK